MTGQHEFVEGQVLDAKEQHYTLIQHLGEGGFGTTFRARQHGEVDEVVVKILRWDRLADWKAVELFEREGDVLKSLEHPNIPSYIDSFTINEEDGTHGYALVQSYVEGESLASLMDSERRLAPDEMLRWFGQLLDVCDYLHCLHPPVIHRDIKPGNIVLRPDGTAVLIDFGTVQAAMASANTISSTAAGTFGYAPMEQFLQRAVPQSDLYGLAVTFVAVACKQEPTELPFVGNRLDVHSALKGIAVDARLVELLAQMTDLDPEQRPASAAEARAVVDEVLAGPSRDSHTSAVVRRKVGAVNPKSTVDALKFVLPAPTEVEPFGDGVRIRWRWFHSKFIFLLFFFFCWDAFLFVWYGTMGSFKTGGFEFIFKLLPLIHVAVGVAGTYYALAGFLNRTTLSIKEGLLTISHAPLPWFGIGEFPIEQIRRVYHQTSTTEVNGRSFAAYGVYASINGRSHKLLENLETAKDAELAERHLARLLGVEDVDDARGV